MCPSAPPLPSAGRQPDELMREVEAWIEAEMRRPSTPKPIPQSPSPWPRPNRAAAPTELASRNPAMRQHPHNATRWCRR